MSAEHLTPETVGALVDNELSPAEQSTAQAHMQTCHACALRVLAAHQLKSATKQAVRTFIPSPGALARLTAHAQQAPPKRVRIIPFRTAAWGAIAALVLLTLSLGMVRLSNERTTLSAELLDQHLATLSDAAAPQVISSDRHTVKPWFQGKLPFSFNLPEPNTLPQDTALQGADLTYVDGKPAALLLFTIHKHHASIFVTQAGQLPVLTANTTRFGFNMSTVRAAGLDLAAVSDVNRPDLDALVATLVKVQ
jgi:anti-sigma factor RsiW